MRTMILGFTGTRNGLTLNQSASLQRLLEALLLKYRIQVAHHGDCEGADTTFDLYCQSFKIPTYAHPMNDSKHRAFNKSTIVDAPAPPIERNRLIVDSSTYMICCPKTSVKPSNLRGQGTWSTIMYAIKREKEGVIIVPDGRIISLSTFST